MSRMFVLAASKMEADPVARPLGISRWDADSHAGPIAAGPNQLEFFITGMGPQRAGERAAEILPESTQLENRNDPRSKTPDALVVIGLCGGLTDSLPETSIVAYSDCLSTINGRGPFPCARELSAQISDFFQGHRVLCQSVIGITSSRIAITRDDKLQLARTGAQVVDMESYEILSAAQKSGVPVAVVRVVSDSPDRKLPDFNRALNPDGSINTGKALRVMLGSPLLTARAYAANKRAAQHLARALTVVLSVDFGRLQ